MGDVKVKFVGPDGELDYDVGRAVGGSVRMKHGETYSVPKDLGLRLARTSFWEGSKALKDEVASINAEAAEKRNTQLETTITEQEGAPLSGDSANNPPEEGELPEEAHPKTDGPGPPRSDEHVAGGEIETKKGGKNGS